MAINSAHAVFFVHGRLCRLQHAATESKEEVAAALAGTDLVFVTVGKWLGGVADDLGWLSLALGVNSAQWGSHSAQPLHMYAPRNTCATCAVGLLCIMRTHVLPSRSGVFAPAHAWFG